mgnify:CR=1 FL=1
MGAHGLHVPGHFLRSGVIEFGCRVAAGGRLVFRASDTGIGIAQSGNACETDRAESARSGCNDFITNPVQSEKLPTVLERYLSQPLLRLTFPP